MTQYFVRYLRLNGAITRVGYGTYGMEQGFLLSTSDSEAYLVSDFDPSSDYYVNLDAADPVLAPKADYTLDALPLPCTVTIEGVEYSVTEQPTFAFNYPGTYTISVDAGVRFLAKEFEIVWP